MNGLIQSRTSSFLGASDNCIQTRRIKGTRNNCATPQPFLTGKQRQPGQSWPKMTLFEKHRGSASLYISETWLPTSPSSLFLTLIPFFARLLLIRGRTFRRTLPTWALQCHLPYQVIELKKKKKKAILYFSGFNDPTSLKIFLIWNFFWRFPLK